MKDITFMAVFSLGPNLAFSASFSESEKVKLPDNTLSITIWYDRR